MNTIDLRDQLKQKKQAYVQDEILSSAAALFAEKGFRAITITDVAASLGYTKSVVYYYFKNKNEILWQIFNRMHQCYEDTIVAILKEELPAGETLKKILFQHALNVMQRKDWTAIYFRDESELEELQRDIMRKRKREYDKMIESVYERGVAEGIFKAVPTHIAVSGFMGMCNWLHTWFDEKGKLAAVDIAATYVELMAGGYQK